MKYFNRFLETVKSVSYLLRDRLFPLSNFNEIYRPCFEGKAGLEVGGPSGIFRNLVPVYKVLAKLDGCNFSSCTVWEGNISSKNGYLFDHGSPAGRQFISEATELSDIGSGQYEFVLSSHCLEHVANPLKAFSEWLRVLKTGGHLLLVLPHKDGTFDHKRPTDTLEHLIADYQQGIKEDDLSHLDEILKLHDLPMDPAAGSFDSFKQRSLENFKNRCLHQHVFDTSLTLKIADYFKMQILDIRLVLPYHIILLAKKSGEMTDADNSRFLSATGTHFRKSPFKSDLHP